MHHTLHRIRERLSDTDLSFVVRTLARDEREEESLLRLLADPEAAVSVLDHPKLLNALQSDDTLSGVSTRLFLYVHLRRSLREMGIHTPDTAEYLASMLANFSKGDRWRRAPVGKGGTIDYEVDLLMALEDLNHFERFEMHAYGGDRNLFLTGMHPRFIRKRRDRFGAPDIDYYEQAGRSHYQKASRHPVAREFELKETFEVLSSEFPRIRAKLNYLTAEHFH
jgi:hypothetical protein